MRVYLAGPMSGIPQFNIPAFDEMAAELRAHGHDVVSPAELDDPETRAVQMRSEHGLMSDLPPGDTWGMFLARDVKLLADDGIEAVVVLPGWSRSRGARLETFVASALGGLSILYWDPVYEALQPIEMLELFQAWTQCSTLSLSTPAYGGIEGWR